MLKENESHIQCKIGHINVSPRINNNSHRKVEWKAADPVHR